MDRHAIAPRTMFVSHETYTPARGGSAAAEVNALRRVFGEHADAIVVTNTKGFTGHAMGAGIEDVVAVKALETGIVPPVPNHREVDPDLGALNLSTGGPYPVEYALRLAAGFGSQVAMSLLRRTPLPGGARRGPHELGYAYRIVDRHAWQAWLDGLSGHADSTLEVDRRRLRVVDVGAPEVPVTPVTHVPVRGPASPARSRRPRTPGVADRTGRRLPQAVRPHLAPGHRGRTTRPPRRCRCDRPAGRTTPAPAPAPAAPGVPAAPAPAARRSRPVTRCWPPSPGSSPT